MSNSQEVGRLDGREKRSVHIGKKKQFLSGDEEAMVGSIDSYAIST